MPDLLKTTLLGFFFGTVGTTLGGILGVKLNIKSNRFLGFILEFAAGLMVSVVCFELIPESLELTNIINVFIGIFIGVFVMIFCNDIVNRKYNKKNIRNTNSLLKTGIIVGIGLAIHNFPEGLAIGSGFDASPRLGFALAIAILLHDIPEGISMSVPMKSGGMKTWKVILYTVASGLTTGIGAFFGAVLGTISETVIAICLAFAAGAMLYIASCELIPESSKLYKGRLASLGNIMGFVIGIIATRI